MSLSDPSAIAIIVGAAAVLAFVIHGLWFSGKPANRKLDSSDKHDRELRDKEDVAKVRIVGAVSKNARAKTAAEKQKPKPQPKPQTSIEECIRQTEFPSSIEINVIAPPDKPFLGEELEELFEQYGIMRGELDIFYVYENLQQRTDEVFRICSLVSPFYFPKDLKDFSTRALALYMNLPPKGKGLTYARALTMAAKVFAQKLGGRLQDVHNNVLDDQKLKEIEDLMQRYDAIKS